MKERKAIIEKKKQVDEISNKMKAYPAIILIDLRNTPDKLLQSTRKKLKEKYKAFVKVAKLAVIKRALEKLKVPKEVYEAIDFPTAVIGIDEEPYRINQFFMQNMLDVPAKPGQVAPYDIVVPKGETDLPPGPALSQLKQAGLKVKIEKGKIVISEDSVVAKAGEIITAEKAQALQMLGIKPFKVGIRIYRAYDGKLIYSKDVLDITPEDVKEGLSIALTDALNFSINVRYPTPQNIEILLTKALMNAMNLAINGNIYSPQYIKELLLKALREANAIKSLEGG